MHQRKRKQIDLRVMDYIGFPIFLRIVLSIVDQTGAGNVLQLANIPRSVAQGDKQERDCIN